MAHLDQLGETMYKGLLASIKLELVNTQHFIDYYEVLKKDHPDSKVPYDVLKRYREFLYWWLRKIDLFKRGQPLESVLPFLELPSLTVFEDPTAPIPR